MVGDILIKAAEDATSGMWCRGYAFLDLDLLEETPLVDSRRVPSDLLYDKTFTLDQAMRSHRCAMGSLAVATAQLGGGWVEYTEAVEAVVSRLLTVIPACDRLADDDLSHAELGDFVLAHWNDHHISQDPFTAGQQVADLFRQTAEGL